MPQTQTPQPVSEQGRGDANRQRNLRGERRALSGAWRHAETGEDPPGVGRAEAGLQTGTPFLSFEGGTNKLLRVPTESFIVERFGPELSRSQLLNSSKVGGGLP